MAFDLAEAEVAPATQDSGALRQVFAAIHAESCPTRFNFHMHTLYSDGQLPPELLMQQAIAIGLDGFAITDHHTVQGSQLAQSWLQDERERLAWNGKSTHHLPHLWTGIEVTSQLLDIEVHILGYAFDPHSVVMRPYLQRQAPIGEDAKAQQVVVSIQAAGGIAILAHPMRYRKPAEDLIAAIAPMGIDGVETFYAYDNPTPWRASPAQTQRVQSLQKMYNLLGTCGTDTHGKSLLQRI
jgi:predicted metal-dependent phosphoesterase TrpH